MKQKDLGLYLSNRRPRKAVCLDDMNLLVLWTELLALIALHTLLAKTGWESAVRPGDHAAHPHR